MTQTDLDAADELRRLTGWNQTRDDWRQLLSFEPHGCFVAVEDDRVVGTVTTTTYGKELAWIGMMLVHPDHRRRGIGTRLMQTALDYLHKCGVRCIRLDATPAGKPVYEKLGFVSEWTLTRHQAGSMSVAKATGVRELVEADWLEVESLDTALFGVGRGRVLRSLAESSRATLVWSDHGRILGCGMLRPGSHCDYLGPLVVLRSPEPDEARTMIAALAFVSTALRYAEGRPVFWDVPDGNWLAAALAQRLGFRPVRPLTRMRLGPNSARSDPAAQLAIADPSLG